MSKKFRRNVNSHAREFLNQSVRMVWDRGQGSEKVQNSDMIFERSLRIDKLVGIGPISAVTIQGQNMISKKYDFTIKQNVNLLLVKQGVHHRVKTGT